MRTAVVVNELASRVRRRPVLGRRIAELAGPRAAVFHTKSLEMLERAAGEIRGRDSERVILCGGDGTFMAGVTALARAFAGRELPELVLAPGGTVATVARNWGQRAGLLQTVRLALASPESGRRSRRPTLQIRDDRRERIGFIFGTGLVAHFFDHYYAAGAGGNLAAAKIVARVFVGSFVADAYSRSVLDPMPCVLEIEGRRHESSAYSLIVCSVVRDLGLHMLVTHRAGEDPSRPHLVASRLSPRQLGPQAPRVFAGKPLRGPGNFDGLVSGFTLRFDGEGPYVLDGDVFRASEVRVTAGPELLVRTFG
jgi:diacylglycerol kinase (ATP)